MPANYEHVNGAWPEQVPVPSPQEALAGARRLVRLALTLGPPDGPKLRVSRYKFKLTSGNRYSYTRNRTFMVNPDKREFGVGRGWQSMCHDISHWAHRRLFGGKPHTAQHAFIERKLAEHVVKSGWLEGKLKRPEKLKPPVDHKAVRAARIETRIASWQRKLKRAENALKKLRRQKAYYERQAKESPRS